MGERSSSRGAGWRPGLPSMPASSLAGSVTSAEATPYLATFGPRPYSTSTQVLCRRNHALCGAGHANEVRKSPVGRKGVADDDSSPQWRDAQKIRRALTQAEGLL